MKAQAEPLIEPKVVLGIAMVNIRDLKIDNASLGKPLLLLEVRPYSDYKDGKAVGGVVGYRYDACLEKLVVKIGGPQLMESPEDGMVKVEFSGLEVSTYQKRTKDEYGPVVLTARATGIKPVNGP